MLFLQAINNILFDEQKLTALLIRIRDARVASLDVPRIRPRCVCLPSVFDQAVLASIRWSHPPLQGKEKQHGCFALELITKSRALIGCGVKFIVKTGGTRPQDKTDNRDKLLAHFIAYFRACYQCKCLQTKTSLRMIGNKLNSHYIRWPLTDVQIFPKRGLVILQPW